MLTGALKPGRGLFHAKRGKQVSCAALITERQQNYLTKRRTVLQDTIAILSLNTLESS